ncbi:MAG TPA: hypothetical protein QF549_01180 [Candidatus Saccharimonadaceae bacterium]|nr:hypothetical protein [Candidatus Saccharimonadaceae bacterium]
MKYVDFGSEYNTYPVHRPRTTDIDRRRFNPEVEAEFEVARMWNVRVDRTVLNHLRGVPSQDDEKIHDTFEEYSEWANEWTENTREAVFLACQNDGLSPTYITEMTFHHIAQSILPQWHTLSGDPEGYSDEALTAAQTRLAIINGELMRQRHGSRALPGERHEANAFSSLTGAATKVDTKITTLETAKQQKGKSIVSFPASRQLELLGPNRNIEQVLLDADVRHARGIQAKTRVGNTTQAALNRKYNPRYVTLIDGITDLGNLRAIRRNGSTVDITEPGMVAMHHLMRTDEKKIPETPHKEAILKQAKRMTRGHSSSVPKAGRRVGAKVMPAPYQD